MQRGEHYKLIASNYTPTYWLGLRLEFLGESEIDPEYDDDTEETISEGYTIYSFVVISNNVCPEAPGQGYKLDFREDELIDMKKYEQKSHLPAWW